MLKCNFINKNYLDKVQSEQAEFSFKKYFSVSLQTWHSKFFDHLLRLFQININKLEKTNFYFLK